MHAIGKFFQGVDKQTCVCCVASAGLRIAASGMVPTPLHSAAAAAAGTTSSLMQPSAAVAGATLPAAAAAGPRLAAGSSGRRGVSRGAAPGDRPAAGAAAVLGGYGPPGSGGLRRLQHLELSAACVMSAAVSVLLSALLAALQHKWLVFFTRQHVLLPLLPCFAPLCIESLSGAQLCVPGNGHACTVQQSSVVMSPCAYAFCRPHSVSD